MNEEELKELKKLLYELRSNYSCWMPENEHITEVITIVGDLLNDHSSPYATNPPYVTPK